MTAKTKPTSKLHTRTLGYIPNRGRGTLPVCDALTHPNLVRVYLDAQYDYGNERIYLVSARVTAAEDGQGVGVRTLARFCEAPPDTAAERELLIWLAQHVVAAVAEKAMPDADGERRAPLHLVVWNRYTLRLLLEGLDRHRSSLSAAVPALYDLLTQKAAFASPTVTFLEDELRRKNLPILCPSLQNVATFLRFPWATKDGNDLRRVFHARVFDGTGRIVTDDGAVDFYTKRARYDSQLPLEYAYAAWDALPPAEYGEDEKAVRDPYKLYREATPDMIIEIAKARVKALDWIADSFYTEKVRGNPKIVKESFDLAAIGEYCEDAGTLAEAVDDFLYIERHTELADWKKERLMPPEQRVLAGDSLLVTYHEADQDHEEVDGDDNMAAEGKPARLKANTILRLRVKPQVKGLPAADALDLFGAQVGDSLIVAPRWVENTWQSEDSKAMNVPRPTAPTPDQLLYEGRAELVQIEPGKKFVGQPVFVTVMVKASFGGDGCFLFNATRAQPLRDGETYTLEPDPNSPLGKWQSDLAQSLCRLERAKRDNPQRRHVLYDRLAGASGGGRDRMQHWDENAQAGQNKFLRGLDALRKEDLMPDLLGAELEKAKCSLIGHLGDVPLVLVQGPPGTGKTTATALAILACVQGALTAGLPTRVMLSCKTHAATDVLLGKVLDMQDRLWAVRDRHPALFARHFHPSLLTLPLLRLAPKTEPLPGIRELGKESNKRNGRRPCNWDEVQGHDACVVAGTPGGIYRMVKGRWGDDLFSNRLCDLLVLDEASQLSLPEALLSGLPLRPSGQVIVVGDPRQMPPIMQHNWEEEPRRACREFGAFRSLYEFLEAQDVPQIKFERSFRIHKDSAEFLRLEVYQKDDIPFYSTNEAMLPAAKYSDPFLAAVLDPFQPLIVVEHDEAGSQKRNLFEQRLMSPLINALTDPLGYNLSPQSGLGVVVPHRAQRALLRSEFPGLASTIDTVERYQGGERDVILVGVTESDPAYIKASGEFLLNPHRAVVALSRATKKTVVVASRSVFTLHTLDDALFKAACLWKNLRRVACPHRLWEGEVEGQKVTVWGKKVAEELGGKRQVNG